MAINYIWNLPKVSPHLWDHWIARGVLDDWELAGISQFATGAPAEVGIGIPNVNLNQRITGSWTEGPRPILTADPKGARTRTQWFDFTAFRLPDIGSRGLGNRQYLTLPGINLHDVSIYKNFPFGGEGSRRVQLRLELFNAFNHPQFNGVSTGLTWNIASNFSNYNERQQASPDWIQNVRGGAIPPTTTPDRLGRAVGEFNGQPGVGAARVIDLAAKNYF